MKENALGLARAFAVVAGLGALSACQNGGGPVAAEAPGANVEVPVRDLAFGADGDERTLTIVNHGSETLAWRTEASAAWLSVTPSSGTLPPGSTTLRVTVRRDGLAPGTHRGEIRLIVGERVIQIAATLERTVRPPLASLSPELLELDTDDAHAALRLANAGDAPLEWSLSGPPWIDLDPRAGSLTAGGAVEIQLVPDRAGLLPGTHTATLTLDSNGGAGQVDVRVKVAAPARLGVSPAGLDLGEEESSATVTVANAGDRPLEWSATPSAGWVDAAPSGGTLAGRATVGVTVTVRRDGLPAGSHEAQLRFTSNGGEASVPVSITIAAPQPTLSVALQGRVVGQFTRTGVAGLTVEYDGGSATTDGQGSFTIEGSPSSSPLPLTIRGSGVFRRVTFARGGDGEWLVLPGGFDMHGFDDMAREFEPRTIRWTGRPAIYFDVTPPDGYPPGSELDTWIDEVRGVLESFVSQWTSGQITAASLTVGTSPPAPGTPGTIVIGFSEDPSTYNSPRTVGVARTFWNGQRAIYASRIWLRFSLVEGPQLAWARRAVVGHELGHALGLGHMDGARTSIMTPTISTGDLSGFDRDVGDVLYSRSPGNTSPDTDDAAMWVGGLVPSGHGGLHEWVCGVDPTADPSDSLR